MLAAGLLSLPSCSKRELPTGQPTAVAPGPAASSPADTVGTALWNTFVRRVEAGEIVDPLGQYVAKSLQDPTTDGQRAQRPKYSATTRTLASIRAALAGKKAGGPVASNVPPIDPCSDGTCGGGNAPATSKFVSTEMVQPWNTPPTGGRSTSGGFYTTENPNGYLYDLKLVKASGAPFHDNPKYHNITLDLNEGAGGDYIYISFTRDPSGVEYQRFSSSQCGTGGDEQPRNGQGPAAPYLNLPITGVYTKTYPWTTGWAQGLDCFSDGGKDYFPIYGKRGTPVNSNYMVKLDMNDGAGGNFVLGYQTRTTGLGLSTVEVGILSSNTDTTPAPQGWIKVGDDLNKGAGGNYIYFCVKKR